MRSAARSMVVFGVYLLVAGAVLAVVPPAALRHTNPAAPYEPVRLLGILTTAVGFYYVAAARLGLVAFWRLSVIGRAFAVAAMAALVIAGASPPAILLIGLVDALGAAWTAVGLRRERA